MPVGMARGDVFADVDVPTALWREALWEEVGSEERPNRSRSRGYQERKMEDFGESWSRGDVDGPHQALIAVRATLILGRSERILRIIF